MDGLWEALFGEIFRLDYMKSRLIRCWIIRPILGLTTLLSIIISNKIHFSYGIESAISQLCIYIFFLSLLLLLFKHFGQTKTIKNLLNNNCNLFINNILDIIKEKF